MLGQVQTTVAISEGTPGTPITRLFFYDGSGNLQYACKAPQPMQAYTWAVTPTTYQGTLTSISVSSNVGTVTVVGNHGLAVGNLVTVAASTTSTLNGNYYIQSVPSPTTFTITTAGVSDGTYNTAALTLSTTAAQSSQPIWSIEKFTYSGSNLAASQWAVNMQGGFGGSTAYRFICDNRAVNTGTTAIAYQ